MRDSPTVPDRSAFGSDDFAWPQRYATRSVQLEDGKGLVGIAHKGGQEHSPNWLERPSLLFFFCSSSSSASVCTTSNTNTPFRRVQAIHHAFYALRFLSLRSSGGSPSEHVLLGKRLNFNLPVPTLPAYPTFSRYPLFHSDFSFYQCYPVTTFAFTLVSSKYVCGLDLWTLCVRNPYSVLYWLRQGAQNKGHPSCLFRVGKHRRRVQDQMERRYQPVDRLPRRFCRYVVMYATSSCTSVLNNIVYGFL